jgi:hypothetical protein
LHVQTPAVHPSPVLPQSWHVPPGVPQSDDDSDVHTPDAQHPSGHDAASQTHSPPWHSRPCPHAVAPPQVQTPPDEQPSAFAPQGVHAAPAVPHADADRVVHTAPVQQPPGHAALQFVHAPPLQIWFWHELHVPPPEPHAVWSLPGLHVDPLQHPSGHDVASQMHAPPEHSWPVAHAGPPPHVHAPCAEQPSPVTWPVADTHAWQASPRSPHAVPVVGEVHVPAVVQHPVGHDV